MNALERIGMNPLPLRTEIKVTSSTTSLSTDAAGNGGGAIGQQHAGVLQQGLPEMAHGPSGSFAMPDASLTTVSTDARVLDALARLPSEQPLIVAAKPLCPVEPQPRDTNGIGSSSAAAGKAFADLLVRALVQSLENSGLFYESHLAEWAGGQRPLSALEREPQSHLGPSNGHATAIHPDLLSTVRQQLELLQTPVLRWSGEAWPGARMDWEIERRHEPAARERPDHGTGAGKEAAWRMKLTLALPRLGPVDVDLQLTGNRLMTRMKARPDSAAALLHGSDHLRQRIAGTGLELKSLAVREMPATSRASATSAASAASAASVQTMPYPSAHEP